MRGHFPKYARQLRKAEVAFDTVRLIEMRGNSDKKKLSNVVEYVKIILSHTSSHTVFTL